MRTTHFRDRLVVDEDRVVGRPVDKPAPEHFVERYRYVRRRFNPSQIDAQLPADEARVRQRQILRLLRISRLCNHSRHEIHFFSPRNKVKSPKVG